MTKKFTIVTMFRSYLNMGIFSFGSVHGSYLNNLFYLDEFMVLTIKIYNKDISMRNPRK